MEKGRSNDNSRSPLTSPVRVSPVMFASRDSKLGSALVAVGAVTPGRLFGQHICNTGRRRSCQTVTVPGKTCSSRRSRETVHNTLQSDMRDKGATHTNWVREPSQRRLWRTSTTRQAGEKEMVSKEQNCSVCGEMHGWNVRHSEKRVETTARNTSRDHMVRGIGRRRPRETECEGSV